MELLNKFRLYLTYNRVSSLTAKNYLSDLRYFLNWYSTAFIKEFSGENLDQTVIDGFKSQNSSKLAASTLERHLSSLRKFSTFLVGEGVINTSPFESPKTNQEREDDKWQIKEIKDYLYLQGASPSSIKNYISDIKQFFQWTDKVIQPSEKWIVNKDIYKNLTTDLLNEYKARLLNLGFSPLSVNRKLSSIRKLISWAHKEGKIPSDFSSTKPDFPYNTRQSFHRLEEVEPIKPNLLNTSMINAYSRIPPVRLAQRTINGINLVIDEAIIDNLISIFDKSRAFIFGNKSQSVFTLGISKIPRIQDPLPIANLSKSFYDPLNISSNFLPFHKKIIHILRFRRPNWYLRYHTYPVAHYFHFGLLIIAAILFGLGTYQHIWGFNSVNVLGTSTFSPRTISIKQKLLDQYGTPITSARNIKFAIHDDEDPGISTRLWEESKDIIPNSEGFFTTSLGENNPIPPEIFLNYPSLWLGISVENSPEIKPRQQLTQVANASNAQALQGMGIISDQNTTNSILALDSTGNLTLSGEGKHIFQSLDSQFVLSGNTLTLSTVGGSNSNIEFVPDGTGIIDFQRPIQNTSNNNNLLEALGSVEFDDNVSIMATTSSQSAFIISQNDIGPLISASVSGIARFTVDNFGSTTIAGNLTLTGNNPIISSNTPNANLSIGASSKGTLTLQHTARGDIEFFSLLNSISATGNLKITGNLTLSSPSATTTFGGITYKWPTSGQSDGYYLKTNGSGTLSWSPIPDLTTIWNKTTANVGIGTTTPNFRLDIQDSQTATAAAQIFNTSTSGTATGLVLKLGNSSSSTDINNKWISFEQSGIGIVGMIKGTTNSAGIQYYTNGIADFAEYLPKNPAENIEFGSVVCLNAHGLVYPCRSKNEVIVGITSESPAFLGGKNLGTGSIAVGLTGQVLTRVSNLNGDIKPGDPLTSSSIPGVAVKAKTDGRIVGRAIKKFNSEDCPFDPSNNFGLINNSSSKICQGKIYVILNVSHYEQTIADKGEEIKNLVLKRTSEEYYELIDDTGNLIEKTGGFQNAIIANLTAGAIKAREIAVDTINIKDNLTINGISLEEYIAKIIKNNSEINSPIASADQINTNIISPLSKSKVIVRLPENSSFSIEDDAGNIAATISSTGDATFSGRLEAQALASQNLISDNASVSGTIRAGKIIADQIEGLPASQSPDFADLATMSSQFAYVGNLRALTGNFVEGLVAQRPSSFSDISIFGQLKIDNSLLIAANSINVLGSNLEIQSLRQGGISLMGGLLYIDTDGNIKVDGNANFAKDVSVKGTLSASTISPLPDQDLIFDINNQGSFILKNGTESALLTIDKNGDLDSSGSASFGKLNLNFVKPAYALSNTEAIATGSAGIATISSYQRELTIRNKLVTDRSLIYITPRVDTNNLVIYLVRQVPGASFTVGINKPLSKTIPFNWVIIN